jgi:acyl-CoA thioesterase-1
MVNDIRWRRVVGALLGVLMALGVFWASRLASHPGHASGQLTRVLVVGGSAARGWRAAHNDGYIDRAFRAYGRTVGVRYVLYNRAIPGAGVRNRTVNRLYAQWVHAVSPGIVVLAWGTLNDLRLGTPRRTVETKVREEIALALESQNVVLLITPIPTRATYTVYRDRQPRLVLAEMSVAESFHSPNVHVLDLFNAMRRYLAAHGLHYRRIMHDHWDPNERGHRVAAELLTKLLEARFGRTPPTFDTGPHNL